MDIRQLREQVERLFSKRSTFMTLCQDIAQNFYPERADFTMRQDPGDEFGSALMTSYPLLCRRELSDQLGTMLRPTAKQWFKMVPKDGRTLDNEANRWLEWASEVQYRGMYDRAAMLSRATKEGDADFATFGQCVLSVGLNKDRDALLYRSWHIRDVVWIEDAEGHICLTARKWKPGAMELSGLFKGKVHSGVTDMVRKDPFGEVTVYHIVCKAELYDGDVRGRPYWSIYYDADHDYIMEEVPVWGSEYVIPRWATISGSQYAYSPATMIALPEARLIQAMTYTLLEAGEKAVNPPLIATHDAVRSDVNLMAGSITWVDRDYDERLGEAVRPLTQETRQIPLGVEMQRDARVMIMQAFYLNKLNLPQRAPEMTAYEVGQRVQEYIRGALPLFEPMESDYNGQLCERTFDVMFRASAFGSVQDMPRSLGGADLEFVFMSPLHDAIEQQKGAKWAEAKVLIADAAAIDQSALALLDSKVALRDALQAVGVPAKWVRSETTVAQIEEAQRAAQESQQALAAMEQASNVAANLGGASKDMSAAGASQAAMPAAMTV